MVQGFKRATALFCISVMIVTACSNPEKAEGGAEMIQERALETLPSSPENKNRLVKMYSQAIVEYLKAAGENNHVKYDTLFFGRHVDFPDIDLPATIKGTKIFVLNPEEIETNKGVYSKSAPYINLMGWVNDEKAEFIAFTFFPEFRHQYDYFINYRYHSQVKEFQLEEVAYEIYADLVETKPKHTIMYQKGK